MWHISLRCQIEPQLRRETALNPSVKSTRPPSTPTNPTSLVAALSYDHKASIIGSLLLSLAAWLALLWLQQGPWQQGEALPFLLSPLQGDKWGLIRLQYALVVGLLGYSLFQSLGILGEYRALGSCGDVSTLDRFLLILGGLPKHWPCRLLEAVSGQSKTEAASDLGAWIDLLLSQHKQARLSWLRYGAWLLPISGFIGTVLGIREAIIPLKDVVGNGDPQAMTGALSDVLKGLQLAFDTTLVGLVSSVPIVVILSLLALSLTRLHTLFYTELESRIASSPRQPGKGDA